MVSTLKRKFGTISAYLSFTPRSQIETRNKNENLENDVSYLRKNLIDLPMFTRTIYTVSCNNDID